MSEDLNIFNKNKGGSLFSWLRISDCPSITPLLVCNNQSCDLKTFLAAEHILK